MKIGVWAIVRDHCATLRSVTGGPISAADVVIFYVVPIAIGIAAYVTCIRLTKDVYNASITFFGIFLALLLNLQVAIFAIFQRKWTAPGDTRLTELQHKTLADRRHLLSELNANISYLTLVSCVGLTAVLVFYAKEMIAGWQPASTIALYAHFLLTLLMIVKRSHALFQKEYRDSPP